MSCTCRKDSKDKTARSNKQFLKSCWETWKSSGRSNPLAVISPSCPTIYELLIMVGSAYVATCHLNGPEHVTSLLAQVLQERLTYPLLLWLVPGSNGMSWEKAHTPFPICATPAPNRVEHLQSVGEGVLGKDKRGKPRLSPPSGEALPI